MGMMGEGLLPISASSTGCNEAHGLSLAEASLSGDWLRHLGSVRE